MASTSHILHVDIDGFAASVERALDPALRGKPLVIGNNAGGRGLVSCASYEARASGIRAGMPLNLARRRLPDAIFLPENPTEYERFSRKLLQLLSAKAPATEAATVDDFYLDLTGCERLFGGDLFKWSRKLARTIEGETALPASIGLATNKMVARVASQLAKPAHCMEVLVGTEADFLAPVAVHLLPGVGEKTCARLRDFGVRDVGHLAALGEPTLRLIFGTTGAELWRRARGQFSEPVKPTALHRQIAIEHAFAEDTADVTVLEAAAALIAQKLAWQLRRHNVRTSTAQFTIIYNDSLTATNTVRLAYASNQDGDFIAPTRVAFLAAFRRRVRVRRMMLRAFFIPCEDAQFDIIEERRGQKNLALYRAVDAVREKHGFNRLLAARAMGA